jgi:ribosome assembly protein YihI (activator of Der GTPase)
MGSYPPIRKRKSSRKPLGRATPKKREKTRKDPTAIPRARKKEKRLLEGFRNASMR